MKSLSKKIFLIFFAEFILLMFHNNVVKISTKLNKRNLENGFALNHDKSLQIYFRVKRQAKNDFLKDGKSTVNGVDGFEKEDAL